MKTSSLFIGLGVGLLVGAAVGIYLVSSDDDKAKFMADVNSTVNKAKSTIGKAVSDGLGELDKATEKVTQIAKDAISKVKPNPPVEI
jgi:gas vesicle protein